MAGARFLPMEGPLQILRPGNRLCYILHSNGPALWER